MFEPTTEIKDLEILIKPHLEQKRIKEYKIEPLKQFGENFGSEMLKIEITITDEENSEENQNHDDQNEENNSEVKQNGTIQHEEYVLHTVAKCIPPTAYQREIFDIQKTFRNEIEFYKEIIEILQQFQIEHGLSELSDYFPKLYGARINLNQSSIVDENAIILLENLNVNGYDNYERQEGFDLETSQKILHTLAHFQATATALKSKKPQLFDTKILPYTNEFKVKPSITHIDEILKENPQIAPLMSRVKKMLRIAELRKKKVRLPWATIIHNDFWVNNIMLKQKDNHQAENLKLIDFQFYDYASVACDVIFFLFSSVQISVLKYHFNKLIRYFYDEFITTLKQFKIDITPFTYASYLEELQIEAPIQIYHSFFMLNVVYGPKGGRKLPGKLAQWNPENTTNGEVIDMSVKTNENGSNHFGNNRDFGPKNVIRLHDECKEKIWYIIEESAKQNWL